MLSNKSDFPELKPLKPGLYISRVLDVKIEDRPNYEKTENVPTLVFKFGFIRNATTGKPLTDVDGIEYAPLSRFGNFFGPTRTRMFKAKDGKTLTKSGDVFQALGMDPMHDEVEETEAIGRYCIVNLAAPKGDSTWNKIAGVVAFEGDTAEFDALEAPASKVVVDEKY